MLIVQGRTMKKIILIVSAISNLAFAGGDFVSVSVPAPVPILVSEVDDSGFYAGAGVTYNRVYSTNSAWFDKSTLTQDQTGGLTGIIGYDFNNYLAIEGRITKSLWERDYSDSTIYSLFLKPQYRFRDAEKGDDAESYFSVYALLGFGNTNVEGFSGDHDLAAWSEDIGKEMMNETSFQWGIGASYTFKDKIDEKPYTYKDSWTIFIDYTSSAKNASIPPTKLYNYDSNYYDELSVDGMTAGIIFNF
jgi:opacity protein-like surface antigen